LAQAVVATDSDRSLDLKHPLNLSGQEFADRKYEIYEWLREEAPVYKARIFSLLKIHLLSRYDDCMALLKDPRFVRNRTTATGGGRMPFPLPRSVALLARSMIVEDEPAHQRQRGLVNTAFKPRAIARIQERIERLTHELLDGVGGLMNTFAQSGLSGWNVFRAFVVELPKATRFMRQLIARKRQDPQDDILTGLIQAEENGERLTENEIVSLVFLLIVAGFETTVHLITNGVIALLQHPDQLERLRSEPQHLESAVEEILRYRGPVHGTKMNYATEDVEWHGITIPKGSAVVPVLGAANHDPRAFDAPDRFDITRSPNRHLAFGHGPHFCLGAQLARMETRLALGRLLERCPNLRLAVKPEQLRLQKLPLWHRHQSLPVVLG
jgi:cytochrome P450